MVRLSINQLKKIQSAKAGKPIADLTIPSQAASFAKYSGSCAANLRRKRLDQNIVTRVVSLSRERFALHPAGIASNVARR